MPHPLCCCYEGSLVENAIPNRLLGGKVDVKVGQQSANLEFMTSQYSGLFINASFGWSILAAVDLPSGGPAIRSRPPACAYA
jgi:hypothetical protein